MKKLSNVMTAGGPIVAPGSSNMSGAGYGTSSVGAGAADIPGMSVHCLVCGKKLKKNKGQCPACGNDTRRVARAGALAPKDEPRMEQPGEVSETGGEAAQAEAKGEMAEGSASKYASTAKSLATFGQSVLGGGAIAGGLIGAVKAVPFKKKMDREAEFQQVQELVAQGKLPESELQKFAGHRLGNPILRIRMAKRNLVRAARKSRLSLVKKTQ